MTTEHCGLEVGYPPSSTLPLMCHLRAWRQNGRRETGSSAHRSPRSPPQGFLVVCSWQSTLHVLLPGQEGGWVQGVV